MDLVTDRIREEMLAEGVIPTARCANDQTDLAASREEILEIILACSEKLERKLTDASRLLSKEASDELRSFISDLKQVVRD